MSVVFCALSLGRGGFCTQGLSSPLPLASSSFHSSNCWNWKVKLVLQSAGNPPFYFMIHHILSLKGSCGQRLGSSQSSSTTSWSHDFPTPYIDINGITADEMMTFLTPPPQSSLLYADDTLLCLSSRPSFTLWLKLQIIFKILVSLHAFTSLHLCDLSVHSHQSPHCVERSSQKHVSLPRNHSNFYRSWKFVLNSLEYKPKRVSLSLPSTQRNQEVSYQADPFFFFLHSLWIFICLQFLPLLWWLPFTEKGSDSCKCLGSSPCFFTGLIPVLQEEQRLLSDLKYCLERKTGQGSCTHRTVLPE